MFSFLHVVKVSLLAFLGRGIPGVELHLPQFDLLVPGAPAVLLELVGSLWMKAGLPQMSAHTDGSY